ncbi:hypothetical protein ACFL1E_00620 [Candidatus Omnitrophota bacterium]
MKYCIYFMMLIAALSVYGCITFEEISGLKTLHGYSKSQEGNERYVEIQEKKFQKLLSAYRDNKLEQGTSRRTIVRSFGEPISAREIDGESQAKERFVYRHPMEFFGSEKVYLFFDENRKLVSWQYEEAQEKTEE